MATTTTTKRITKAQRFNDIKDFLNGETPTHGSSVEELVAFCDSELAMLAKKNSSSKKPTKTQEENETYKELIMGFLMGTTDGVTCTEVQQNVPEFAYFNNQKITALMRQLVEAGKVSKVMVKGRAIFSLT